MLSGPLRRQMTKERFLRAARTRLTQRDGIQPLYGDDIFRGDTITPRTWDDLVGQERTVGYLRAAIASAKDRGDRLGHTLLASGVAGIGKTSIAKLIAVDLGTGFVEISPQQTPDKLAPVVANMDDGDVLFVDEVHQAVMGGRAKGEWFLHLLQDGGLVTANGFERAPDITVVAATTDAQKLPMTVLSRFQLRPVLEAYDLAQCRRIVAGLASRLHLDDLPGSALDAVAAASNGSPRDMRSLLMAVRDTAYAGTGEHDVTLALSWAGISYDGLGQLAQDYLLALTQAGGKASLSTLAALLGEPGPLSHTEQVLHQVGYMSIEPGGRALTDAGFARAADLWDERGLGMPS